MTLEATWFFLWGLLWALYFLADGFDLGIGMLLPFIAKGEAEKRMLYNAIGPVWNGNEVWLITAGGVTFAAFPKTYAILFSSLYVAFTLLLVALILRGICLEYRSKVDGAGAKSLCDAGLFVASTLVALLIGVAFANIFRGLPLENGVNRGSFLDLLNPYGVAGGVFFIAIFLLHGAVWLAVKTGGALQQKAYRAANGLWIAVLILTVVFLAYSFFETNLFVNYLKYPLLFLVPALAVAALLLCRMYLSSGRPWSAWFASAGFIFACTFFTIVGLFPVMLPSSIDPAHNITLHQAASSGLTLRVMLVVVAIFVPLALLYQIWAYRLFSRKIDDKELIY